MLPGLETTTTCCNANSTSLNTAHPEGPPPAIRQRFPLFHLALFYFTCSSLEHFQIKTMILYIKLYFFCVFLEKGLKKSNMLNSCKCHFVVLFNVGSFMCVKSTKCQVLNLILCVYVGLGCWMPQLDPSRFVAPLEGHVGLIHGELHSLFIFDSVVSAGQSTM